MKNGNWLPCVVDMDNYFRASLTNDEDIHIHFFSCWCTGLVAGAVSLHLHLSLLITWVHTTVVTQAQAACPAEAVWILSHRALLWRLLLPEVLGPALHKILMQLWLSRHWNYWLLVSNWEVHILVSFFYRCWCSLVLYAFLQYTVELCILIYILFLSFFQILFYCFSLNTFDLDCFFNLPAVSEFIIDLLTQPNDPDIRSCAVEQFHTLCNIVSASTSTSPRQFMMKVS